MKRRNRTRMGTLLALAVLITASLALPTAVSAQTEDLTGKLVFQSTFGGDIYTINADGTELAWLTTGIEPAWSPDGEQIAFTRWADPRGVYVIDADGSAGSEQRVFDWDEARWASWSSDGSQVLFSIQDGGRTEETEQCRRGRCRTLPANPHWHLGIVDADGTIFYEPTSSDFSMAPSWSPDGETIVYDGEQGLVVQSVDGSVSYALTDNANDTSPVWSPDGEQVAFVRRQHDHWEIYIVDGDGTNLTRLTETAMLPDGTQGNSVSPAWSPDGESIAFLTDRSGVWEIWVMAADGSGQEPMFGSQLEGLTLAYSFAGERAIDWTE